VDFSVLTDYASNIPSATTENSHTSARTVVIRFKFRSAAADPSAAAPPPPNMSLRPPPRPLCRRTPTTIAMSERTLMTRVTAVMNERMISGYLRHSGKWQATLCPPPVAVN